MIQTAHASYEVESFVHEKLRGQFRTDYCSEKKLRGFLEDPEQDLKKYGGGPPIKDDKTTTVSIVPNLIKDCPIVIKRYNTKNPWHALRRTVRRSRAKNCWVQAMALENLGVAVAPPVAFIQEFLGAGLKGRSWYLSEFVDGPSCLDHLPTIDDKTVHEQVMEQIIDTLKLLWKQRITHGDLKGSNILLAQDRIVVLDLDSVKTNRVKFVANHRIRKDMMRFSRNWQDYPALAELARDKLSNAGFSEFQ